MDEWIPWVQVPDPKNYVLIRNGVTLGWGPTEESLTDLKRQIGGDISKVRRTRKKAPKPKKEPSDPKLDPLSSLDASGYLDQLLGM